MPVHVLVLRAAGINCDVETASAFELAGASAERIHLRRILQSPSVLDRFQILALPGGFSYADDLSAGKVLALQLSHRLGEALHDFLAKKKLILGICNGFQTLLKTNLLLNSTRPAIKQSATLTQNVDGRFHDRWTTLEVRSKKCLWTAGLDRIELPIAHAEGRFVTADHSVIGDLWDNDQVVLTYENENTSGSSDGIAGVCDASGLVFGLMPHPERFVWRHQHYAWSSQTQQNEAGDGLALFQNAVRWFD